MQYWDEVIDAATLTGYARAELELLDQDTLARFLPNSYVEDISIEFEVGQNGLISDALYRAYDAEPEIAGEERGESVLLKLPAVSRKEILSEYAQLRLRGSEGGMERAIRNAMRRAVRAVANTADRARGSVLYSGNFTVNQRNFKANDNFARNGALSFTASTLWSSTAANRLDALKGLRDLVGATGGAEPGAFVMDRDAFAAFSNGDQFQVALANGASRPSSEDEIRSFAVAAGLPPIEVNSRRTANGPVLPSGTVLALPAPVDANDPEGTELGGTAWGTPLSSMEESYEIPDGERPGIVAIAEKSTSVPHIGQVTADSIQLPFLANANLSGRMLVL